MVEQEHLIGVWRSYRSLLLVQQQQWSVVVWRRYWTRLQVDQGQHWKVEQLLVSTTCATGTVQWSVVLYKYWTSLQECHWIVEHQWSVAGSVLELIFLKLCRHIYNINYYLFTTVSFYTLCTVDNASP